MTAHVSAPLSFPSELTIRTLFQSFAFGAPYSVYVRTVRLALEEKGVQYELVPIDIFAPGAPPEQKVRHPFAKIPTFEHAGFSLYEVAAPATAARKG